MIELCDLSIGYRGRAVATGLSGSPGGGLTCLLGRNGVGKSTLLRTLAGFVPPLAGSVRLLGRDLGSYSVGELSRTLGVVLTERGDLGNLTVRELVGMGRTPYTGFWGRLAAEDERLVDEAMEQVGIGELAQRQIGTLSDGERQKTMIAKALAQQTPVILLDEPTAFLDFPSKVDTMRLLRLLAREKTILLSTHDLELALRMADRLCLMGDGLRVGTLDELTEDGSLGGFLADRGIAFDPVQRTFLVD